MSRPICLSILILLPAMLLGAEDKEPSSALSEEVVTAMRAVHARFDGQSGSFAQLGDSITDTMAFWAPLQWQVKNAEGQDAEDHKLVKSHTQEAAFRLKGGGNGNQSGQTTAWALKNVDGWMQKLDPEVAVILFGTNDLKRIDVEAFTAQMRTLVQKCLDNGTVPLLTTVPPFHGKEEKAAAFAEAARGIAAEFKVPLIDFHKEILERRPDDWYGGGDAFKNVPGGTYEVPTLISRDGVHPSNFKAGGNDFSEEGLKTNGYTLRNYLTMRAYAAVIRQVIKAE